MILINYLQNKSKPVVSQSALSHNNAIQIEENDKIFHIIQVKTCRSCIKICYINNIKNIFIIQIKITSDQISTHFKVLTLCSIKPQEIAAIFHEWTLEEVVEDQQIYFFVQSFEVDAFRIFLHLIVVSDLSSTKYTKLDNVDGATIIYDQSDFVSTQKVASFMGFVLKLNLPPICLVFIRNLQHSQLFGADFEQEYKLSNFQLSIDNSETIFQKIAETIIAQKKQLLCLIEQVKSSNYSGLKDFNTLFFANIFQIIGGKVFDYVDYLLQQTDVEVEFVQLVLTKLAESGLNTISVLDCMIKNNKFINLDFDILPEQEVVKFVMRCYGNQTLLLTVEKAIVGRILQIQKHSTMIQQYVFSNHNLIVFLIDLCPNMTITVLEPEFFDEIFSSSMKYDLQFDFRQITQINIDLFITFLFEKKDNASVNGLIQQIFKCRTHYNHLTTEFLKQNLQQISWISEVVPSILDDQGFVAQLVSLQPKLQYQLLRFNKMVKICILQEEFFENFAITVEQFSEQVDLDLLSDEIIGKFIIFLKSEKNKFNNQQILSFIMQNERKSDYVISKLLVGEKKLIDWLSEYVPIYKEIHGYIQQQKQSNALQKQKDKYEQLLQEKEVKIQQFENNIRQLTQQVQSLKDVVFFKNEKIQSQQDQYEKLLKQLEIANKQQSQTIQSGQLSSEAMRMLHSMSQFMFSTTLTLMKQLKPIKDIPNVEYQVIQKVSCENDYEIQRVIGKGEMGSVYLISPKSNSMLLFAMREIENLDTVFRERNSVKIQHPNIAQVYREYKQGKFVQIVEELVQGASIRTIIKSKGGYIPEPPLQYSFTTKQIAFILKQLSSALFHAHKEYKVAHHDLKPDNILLQLYDPENFYGVKVIDFGIDRNYTFNSSALDGQLRYQYLPPEIVLNSAKHSTSMDVWAFGCILYELCTLKILTADVLYKFKSEKRTIEEIYRTMYQSMYKAQLPEEYKIFQNQLTSCLQERPDKRPTADQLAKDWFAIFVGL